MRSNLGNGKILDRRGFSLIELLLVIAIIGVLIALLLPAIEKARDMGNRLGCANNLRQMGTALHHYYEQNESFPPAYSENLPYPYLSWRGRLLPFMEQDSLWSITDDAFQNKDAYAWRNPPHVGLCTLFSTYSCPADGRRLQHDCQQVSEVSFSSYLGVSGTNFRKTDGVLFGESQTRFSDITDGSSNTIVVGERPPADTFSFGMWYADRGQVIVVERSPQPTNPVSAALISAENKLLFPPGQSYTGSAGVILGTSEINTRTNGYADSDACPAGPYSYGMGTTNNPCDQFHFWSFHTGGSNFLFGDGSVRFLRYSIGLNLIPLGTRAASDSTTAVDY